MTAREIINEIAKDDLVRRVVLSMHIAAAESDFNLDDLCQDIWLSLMGKPEQVLQNLWERNEFEYYIMRMAANNICSGTSPYFQVYKRPLPQPDKNLDREELEQWQRNQ